MEFAKKIVLWIDKNGVILDRGSSPFSSWLSMEYKIKGIHTFFKVTQSPYSNGYALLEIKEKRKIVFKAEGEMIGSIYFKNILKHSPGEWKDIFSERIKQ